MKLKSASCQIAYWESGKLRIANYLTRRTFASNPVTLELIRFFATPSTIQKALVEFHSYSRESVAASILKLIEAQLLLEHGSAGRAYLLKERVASVDELARAIRTVASGGSVIDPTVVDELVKARAAEHSSGLSLLTARESQILGEMAQGKSNSAIAAALYVTERAVEKHTNSIFAKLGLSEEKDVNRRVKAVLVFLSHQGANGP